MAANSGDGDEFNIQFKLLSSITVNWNCQYLELGCVYLRFSAMLLGHAVRASSSISGSCDGQ